MHIRRKKFTAEELRNKKRFFGNTTIQIIGTVVNVATGMAMTGLLARYLGVKGYGELSLALAYFSFAGIIATLGYTAILVREVVKIDLSDHRQVNTLATSGLVLRIASTAIAVLLLTFYILYKDYSGIEKWQIIFLSLCHFTGILSIFDFVFRATLRMQYSVYASIVYRMLHLLMVAACVYFGTSLLVIISTYLVANFVNGLIVYLFFRKFSRFRFIWNAQTTVFILKEAFPLGLAGGLWMLYHRIDILMLDWLKDVSSVAIYSAAFRFVDYAYMISAILMSSIYPLMASRYPDNPVGFKRIYQKSFDNIAIVGGVGSILTLMFSGLVIRVIFGNEFDAAITTLRIMSFIPLFICLNNVYGHMYLVLGMQGKPQLTMGLLGLVFNGGLNLVLIPSYSYYGAAWATVATECFFVLVSPFVIGSRLKYRISSRNFFLIFFLMVTLFALVVHVDNTWVHILVPPLAFILLVGLLARCNRDELLAMVSQKLEG